MRHSGSDVVSLLQTRVEVVEELVEGFVRNGPQHGDHALRTRHEERIREQVPVVDVIAFVRTEAAAEDDETRNQSQAQDLLNRHDVRVHCGRTLAADVTIWSEDEKTLLKTRHRG